MAIAVAIAVATAATIGTGFDRPANAATKVPVESYLQRVCDSVIVFNARVAAATAPLELASEQFQLAPSQATATGVRQALASFLGTSAAAFDESTTVIAEVGSPRVAGGARFSSELQEFMESAGAWLGKLAKSAQDIPVDEPNAFVKEVTRIEKRLDRHNSRLLQRASSNPAFSNAARSLEPLVTYLTTEADVCAAPYNTSSS